MIINKIETVVLLAHNTSDVLNKKDSLVFISLEDFDKIKEKLFLNMAQSAIQYTLIDDIRTLVNNYVKYGENETMFAISRLMLLVGECLEYKSLYLFQRTMRQNFSSTKYLSIKGVGEFQYF